MRTVIVLVVDQVSWSWPRRTRAALAFLGTGLVVANDFHYIAR